MSKNKIIFLISTGFLTVMMTMSAGMYIIKHDDMEAIFTGLGYPTHIIYPLAIAKILGLVAIWTNKSATLREWAYAGFLFDFVLAFAAHIAVSDGEHIGAVIALVLWTASYFFGNKMRQEA
jgi:hypothetical protein